MTKAQRTASTSWRRRQWIAPLALMVVAAAGIGVGLVAANGDDRNDDSSGTQIANVQQACQNWMGSSATVDVAGDWCRNMGNLMSQQYADGHLGGSMMWGDRSAMLETCRQWANTEPASTTNDRPCDDMVSWMNDHMGGDWYDWTMRGSMMGR